MTLEDDLKAFLDCAEIELLGLEISRVLSHLDDPEPGMRVDITPRRISWSKDGVQHSDGDRPAAIYSNGVLIWWVNGVLHRDGDEPASVDHAHGTKEWYVNGKLHRDGGKPAVIYADGAREWWVNGKWVK